MRIRSVSLALLLFGAAACASVAHSGTADQNQPTVVVVDNQSYLDMNVYAVRSGQRIRLGTANGVGKTSLTIPSTLVSGVTPIRFVADPIGGTRASVSQEITVSPGDTVVMQIPPT